MTITREANHILEDDSNLYKEILFEFDTFNTIAILWSKPMGIPNSIFAMLLTSLVQIEKG